MPIPHSEIAAGTKVGFRADLAHVELFRTSLLHSHGRVQAIQLQRHPTIHFGFDHGLDLGLLAVVFTLNDLAAGGFGVRLIESLHLGFLVTATERNDSDVGVGGTGQQTNGGASGSDRANFQTDAVHITLLIHEKLAGLVDEKCAAFVAAHAPTDGSSARNCSGLIPT